MIIYEHFSEKFHPIAKYDNIVNKSMNTKNFSYQYHGNFWELFEKINPKFKIINFGVNKSVGKLPTEGSLFWKIYEK